MPKTIGQQIRELREANDLPLRKVAAAVDIDQSILSKIERGERRATRELIIKFAELFNVDEKQMLINYFSDKVLYEIVNEEFASEILKVAEAKVEYLNKPKR
ncbi:helix-turn-helix domain-containing protein [Brumimicrobium glaciale]|nr:helix-turn-helix transcriptional regulator [Brumimicrobium glaciale]